MFWIPAYAGMTNVVRFSKLSIQSLDIWILKIRAIVTLKKFQKSENGGRKLAVKQKGATVFLRNPLIFLVGARGFEPPTL
jgi:hypothetical protein